MPGNMLGPRNTAVKSNRQILFLELRVQQKSKCESQRSVNAVYGRCNCGKGPKEELHGAQKDKTGNLKTVRLSNLKR